MSESPLRRWQCPGCGKRYTDKEVIPFKSKSYPPCGCWNAKNQERIACILDEEAAQKLAVEAKGGKLLTLLDCPRCGGMHENLEFKSIESFRTWIGICPMTERAVHLSNTPPSPGLPMPSEAGLPS